MTAYELGPDFIRVQFESGSVYVYTNESAGASTVEWMKMLARTGDGLSAFITRQVRDRYAKKEC